MIEKKNETMDGERYVGYGVVSCSFFRPGPVGHPARYSTTGERGLKQLLHTAPQQPPDSPLLIGLVAFPIITFFHFVPGLVFPSGARLHVKMTIRMGTSTYRHKALWDPTLLFQENGLQMSIINAQG